MTDRGKKLIQEFIRNHASEIKNKDYDNVINNQDYSSLVNELGYWGSKTADYIEFCNILVNEMHVLNHMTSIHAPIDIGENSLTIPKNIQTINGVITAGNIVIEGTPHIKFLIRMYDNGTLEFKGDQLDIGHDFSVICAKDQWYGSSTGQTLNVIVHDDNVYKKIKSIEDKFDFENVPIEIRLP